MTDRRSFALAGARPQYGPDKIVDVHHIDLHLRPDFATKTLFGICTQTIAALEDGVTSIQLDAVDLEVTSVALGGKNVLFGATSTSLDISFEQPLVAHESVEIVITYQAVAPRRGLYFIEPRGQLWTQSQDQDARYWFPCFDHPAEKQTTSTTIVVPKGTFALSNGELVKRSDEAETTVFRYEQRIPHATYLVSLVAGMYSEVRQAHPRLPVWYFVAPGREADGERAFGNTPRMIDCFEACIGVPYAYERYGQITVADFVFGGMENTTATTQTERTLHDARAQLDFSSDPLVAHELAHQWFGNLVTCRDWSQAWLNEGFATYFETVWREADLGWDEYVYDVFTLIAEYLDEDLERYRRPIVCNVYRDPIELFDAHLYQKAAAVLHMLRGELGWDPFRRSICRYVRDNAQRSVETIDLIRAIETTTGRNMRGFFAQWLERGGHPELRVSWRWDAAQKTAYVTLEQQQTIDAEQPAYDFTIEIGFVGILPTAIVRDAGADALPGEARTRLHIDGHTETFAIPLAAQPRLIRVDPGAYVVATLSYAFDDDMHVAILAADPSPVSRIRAAKALSMSASRIAREALATALACDPFWGVGREVATALGEMRSPSARATLLANVKHPHAKVRRAVARALGHYHDTEIADALLTMRDDVSYFVVADAYEALGKTRDARAYAALVTALGDISWNETIEAGAARGLAELADPRAWPELYDALRSTRGEGLRRAAVRALGRLGSLTESLRTRTVEVLENTLLDPSFNVRISALRACETLLDPRLLAALDRIAVAEADGRLKRDAAEAALRIREAQKLPRELAGMREELDRLRLETHTLRERLDELQKT